MGIMIVIYIYLSWERMKMRKRNLKKKRNPIKLRINYSKIIKLRTNIMHPSNSYKGGDNNICKNILIS